MLHDTKNKTYSNTTQFAGSLAIGCEAMKSQISSTPSPEPCSAEYDSDNTSFSISSEMRDRAYNICREFLSGSWKKINSDDMVFEAVRYVEFFFA